jgi:hypothetical protein
VAHTAAVQNRLDQLGYRSVSRILQNTILFSPLLPTILLLQDEVLQLTRKIGCFIHTIPSKDDFVANANINLFRNNFLKTGRRNYSQISTSRIDSIHHQKILKDLSQSQQVFKVYCQNVESLEIGIDPERPIDQPCHHVLFLALAVLEKPKNRLLSHGERLKLSTLCSLNSRVWTCLSSILQHLTHQQIHGIRRRCLGKQGPPLKDLSLTPKFYIREDLTIRT